MVTDISNRLLGTEKECVLNAHFLGLPQPPASAMASAEYQLRRFDKNYRFPLGGDPNSHRYLEATDGLERILRAILRHKHARRFLVRRPRGSLFSILDKANRLAPVQFWMPVTENGDIDIRLMDPTVADIKNIGMAVLLLGLFGLVLFKGVSETWTKVVVFLATAAGLLGVMVIGGSRKNALLLGLMAVIASVIFGGRDNA